ncbi:MAG: hypothetical protein JNK37_11630 [Verrucomicrobiales bacterium]|nr:hypothetical protein [Verrucomicrobiales bacterium]
MHLPSLLNRRLPSAPPLGSVWLDPRPLALFNQWLHWDRPTLIVRGPGLSVCLETEFGLFFEQDSAHQAGPGWAADPVSGLAIQPAAIGAIALLAGPGAPPAIEIAFGVASPFSLAVQPRTDAASDRLIRRIAAEYHAGPAQPETLRERGAGAWLDQWMPALPGWASSVVTIAHGGGAFTIAGPGLRFSTQFAHIDCDRDGNTCRLTDRHRRAVAYVDRTRHFLGSEFDQPSLP